ncbi:hypothetical protein GCM10009647_052220 [Streptomyces sanglieri]
MSLLYWGWGTREEIPTTLLESAAAHRVYDGGPATADGGLVFLRFGDSFTLEEFNAIETEAGRLFRHEGIDSSRWLTTGKVSSRLGDECLFALLLTGIDANSLSN